MEGLKIGDTLYQSRLLIGTAGYPNFDLMIRALEASGAEIATVAMRRVKLSDASGENLFKPPPREGIYNFTEHLRLLHSKGCRVDSTTRT